MTFLEWIGLITVVCVVILAVLFAVAEFLRWNEKINRWDEEIKECQNEMGKSN